jgi:transposase, IS605 OrfB family, central region
MTYKLELKLNKEQQKLINSYIGVSRWVYNKFLEINNNNYDKNADIKYMDAYAFSKWFNNEYLKQHPKDLWIKEYYAKHVKQAMIDADINMKAFFRHERGRPKFRSFKKHQGSYYFCSDNRQHNIKRDDYKIKLPKIGFVKYKERGYIPIGDEFRIVSGRIKERAGRYYLTALVEQPDFKKIELIGESIGIDLGIKDFAILNNGVVYKNLNKSIRIRKFRKQLRRLQRKQSRQYQDYKRRLRANNYEKRATTDFNLAKTQNKILRLNSRITNILNDYQNKIIADVVRTKPQFVAIEDLDISGMVKNHHLARQVQQQKFYRFRTRLVYKCQWLGIPVHLVDRFYPSSKTCSQCGFYNEKFRKMNQKFLNIRAWDCPNCGSHLDRDINASENICITSKFKLAY